MPQRILGHARSSTASWTRRCFLTASGAALLGRSGGLLEAAEPGSPDLNAVEAIDFPRSFLYCSPTGSGIWVRVQIECCGYLTDLASNESNEYIMGVVAKTGLSPMGNTGEIAPGYDYWIIFSKTHVFTKRSHSSAYLNNPTVLEHKDFGKADWRLQRVSAEPLRSPADIRRALEAWRRMAAKTVFTSADGARQFTVEYPVKWADYSLKSDGYRVETGPVFLLDADKLEVGVAPRFDDFQWAYLDFHDFDRARCLVEQPTSVLADATFTPPAEHGRENRENPALTEDQVKEIHDALNSGDRVKVPRETVRQLLSTDHYSLARDVTVRNELYALPD
jgi:hypothetical protein